MKVFDIIIDTLCYPTKFSAGYFECLRHLHMVSMKWDLQGINLLEWQLEGWQEYSDS